jgi:hypothetical protein
LPEGVAFHLCGIRQGELPDRTFDAVVHLAALAGVRPSMDRPMEYERPAPHVTTRQWDVRCGAKSWEGVEPVARRRSIRNKCDVAGTDPRDRPQRDILFSSLVLMAVLSILLAWGSILPSAQSGTMDEGIPEDKVEQSGGRAGDMAIPRHGDFRGMGGTLRLRAK